MNTAFGIYGIRMTLLQGHELCIVCKFMFINIHTYFRLNGGMTRWLLNERILCFMYYMAVFYVEDNILGYLIMYKLGYALYLF